MHISELWIYPVKSLRGISLQSSELDFWGLKYDRNWMLVDADGKFLSQRQLPRMTLIATALSDEGIVVSANGHDDFLIPFEVAPEQEIVVTVWNDTLTALLVSEAANTWFSRVLETPVRLVAMDARQTRQVDPDYAGDQDQTAFSDGFPLLLIGQASLDDLNSRLEQPLPMKRFRPNLVVDNTLAYDEDNWRRIRIGDLSFRVVKPCSRCMIPTIDTETGEPSSEPLRTLATYRRNGNKVYFGQNLLHDRQGLLSVGDRVSILD